MQKRKIPASYLPSVMWADKNKEFYFTHAKAYPKMMWISRHYKIFAFCSILVLIFMITTFFFPVLKIPLCVISFILILLNLWDMCATFVNEVNFYKDAIDRGGEIIDPWNKRIISKKNKLINIALIIVCSLAYFCLLAFVLLDFNQRFITEFPFSTFALLTNFFTIYCSAKYSYPGIYYCIFLNFNEGMLFGNALFTYDIMNGLITTGKNNGFELYHEGKKVAEGRILPDDYKHLQDILEVRNKYKDVLEEVI